MVKDGTTQMPRPGEFGSKQYGSMSADNYTIQYGQVRLQADECVSKA